MLNYQRVSNMAGGKPKIEIKWDVNGNPHIIRGLVNVPIEHPNIGDIIFNKYLTVMFKIPKIGHLPSPVTLWSTYKKLLKIAIYSGISH